MKSISCSHCGNETEYVVCDNCGKTITNELWWHPSVPSAEEILNDLNKGGKNND